MVKWDRLLSAERVVVGLRATRKFDAIRELAAVIEGDAAVGDYNRFLADVIKREKEGSTEIGYGVAIPHVHEEYIQRQVLALGISQEGIDFQGMDDTLVQIVAFFASPRKHQKQHMELLAALSRQLQTETTRERLISAKDAAEVIEVFTGVAQPV